MVAGRSSVWLVGSTVSGDWNLIQALKSDHVVTLIDSLEPARLGQEMALKSAALIVVDCSVRTGDALRIFEAIREMKKKFRKLEVLLVDGQLNQTEIIQAHKMGARDFFPCRYEARLLAEKIAALCRCASH